MKRILIIITSSVLIIALLIFLAFKFTPWPMAMLIRHAFNKEGIKVNEALKRHVPAGIISLLNQQYMAGDKKARLDVYYPSPIRNTSKALPVIVWVHGGGWISGSKEQIGNYCKILASYGYVVASIDYAIAPEKKYPLPVIQTNAALLAYLLSNATRLHVDTAKFILAGDSGGAHIAAQLANVIADNTYARLMDIASSLHSKQLCGLLLYCGPYDARQLDLNGSFGIFLNTVLWSYSGKKDFLTDQEFKKASVIDYMTSGFPPSFISAGNGDPLLPQSRTLARKLQTLGVKVDTLFFRPDFSPSLPHEYQFNLDNSAGKLALEKSISFLRIRPMPVNDLSFMSICFKVLNLPFN